MSNGMGTVVFSASDIQKPCWSQEEIALLTTRMILEDLLPDTRTLAIDSDDYVTDIVAYFRLLIDGVQAISCGRKKHITMLALTDLLGGYLQHAVLPISRQAYYAGVIDYASMEKLIQLLQELKFFLRTNGQGWSSPIESENSFDVEPIDFGAEGPKSNKSCCRNLIYYRHEPSRKRSADEGKGHCYFFPVPFLDAKEEAAYLVMKYFFAVEGCFRDLQADATTSQKFHNNLFTWIEKQVIPKLKDDRFYSAFGGILRVEETLKSMGARLNDEEKCPEDGEEELGTVPGGESSSRSGTVLLVMLVIIFVWFIVGTLFICYRMRANNTRGQGKVCTGPKSDGTCSGSSTGGSSKWSILSRSSSKSTSSETTCKCCSTESDKTGCKCSSTTSGKSTGETTSQSSEQEQSAASSKRRTSASNTCICDGCAIIDTKHSMKVLPSIPEMSEDSSMKRVGSKSRRISFEPLATSSKEEFEVNAGRASKRKICVSDLKDVDLGQCAYLDKATSASSSKTKSSGKEVEGQVSDSATDDTIITANSPHIYACHSSLMGNYTTDQRYPLDKPYIFGYDFQTSSSSADVSDEDTDRKTSSTRYRLEN
ncbi:hypothetical protein NQ318_005692 [Aromia moschata]|uniref:Uncharacterized protein n=1 Tax=Aromia moschata TaxID=1265417 RepID=A0AAV8XKD1_9CUCU|nr:hypothetical protein NQ318_005692 [Aromia moschata]